MGTAPAQLLSGFLSTIGFLTVYGSSAAISTSLAQFAVAKVRTR